MFQAFCEWRRKRVAAASDRRHEGGVGGGGGGEGSRGERVRLCADQWAASLKVSRLLNRVRVERRVAPLQEPTRGFDCRLERHGRTGRIRSSVALW